jgi:hypothetical protein
MSLRNLAASAAAAVVALAAAPASAVTFYEIGPVGADGGFTIAFGNLGINTPTFDDLFIFEVPAGPDGTADFIVSSTMSTDSQNITFTSVTFDGLAFNLEVNGWNETRFLNLVPVDSGVAYELRLTGTAGAGADVPPNATYTGQITFAPQVAAVVPEPGTWALMILGFGGAGAILRTRRPRGTTAPA